MKIDDVYEEYIEFTSLSKRSKEIYINCYNIFWKDLIGQIDINNLDYTILQSGFNTLKDKYSYNTLKQHKASLKIFLRVALLKKTLTEMIDVAFIYIGRAPPKKNDTVRVEEFFELIIHIRKSTSKNKKTYEMALWIGFFTGMRISEVLNLNKKDVNFIKDEIYINKSKTPDGIRTVYMCRELKLKLLEYVENLDSEILLPNEIGGHIVVTNLSCYINYFAKTRNYKIHFHSLRQLFVKTMIKNNVNFEVIRALIGHKNINSVIDLYLRSSEDERKEAINNVYNNDTFENLLNNYKTKKA